MFTFLVSVLIMSAPPLLEPLCPQLGFDNQVTLQVCEKPEGFEKVEEVPVPRGINDEANRYYRLRSYSVA